MSRADTGDRITRELMRLLLSEDADISRLKQGYRLDERERRAYVGRLKALMRTSGIFYDGVGFVDKRALHVHWVRLDGTVARHRYDAIMDMIARGYANEAISQYFKWCDRTVLTVYRKAYEGRLTTGLYSDRGGNPAGRARFHLLPPDTTRPAKPAAVRQPLIGVWQVSDRAESTLNETHL